MSNTYDINNITSEGLIQAQNAYNATLTDTTNFINGHLSATPDIIYDKNNLVNKYLLCTDGSNISFAIQSYYGRNHNIKFFVNGVYIKTISASDSPKNGLIVWLNEKLQDGLKIIEIRQELTKTVYTGNVRDNITMSAIYIDNGIIKDINKVDINKIFKPNLNNNLIAPEFNWVRYHATNSLLNYIGTWTNPTITNAAVYKQSLKRTNSTDAYTEFKFFGYRYKIDRN